jgi:hypothetical protein
VGKKGSIALVELKAVSSPFDSPSEVVLSAS